MRGRKRHLKKVAKKKELQAAKKSSCKSGGCKKKATPLKSAPKVAPSLASQFSYYGKSKVCHVVTVSDDGVVSALCGDVWTPGDEKAAPTVIDAITDDRRLCKKCEKKQ